MSQFTTSEASTTATPVAPMTRRDFLRIGASGFGKTSLMLAELLRLELPPVKSKTQLVFLYIGGQQRAEPARPPQLLPTLAKLTPKALSANLISRQLAEQCNSTLLRVELSMEVEHEQE